MRFSNPGDGDLQEPAVPIFASYAGPGTTAVGAEKANQKDQGQRSYTLIQRNKLYKGTNIADICYRRVKKRLMIYL